MLSLAGASVCSALGCWPRAVDKTVLRLGYCLSVSHAPALLGVHSGRFSRALSAVGVAFEARAFTAGPAAMGALIAGAVDVLYAGPVPIATGFLRMGGGGVRVISGAASGGAGLMLPSRGPRVNFHSATVATLQLGSSQDIALRKWLSHRGIAAVEQGGDVRVTALSGANVVQMFRRGRLSGAWVPEPWAARLELEADGVLAVDERSVWPGGRFASAVVAVRDGYLQRARENVSRWLTAHTEEVEKLRREKNILLIGEAFGVLSGQRLSVEVLSRACERIEYTVETLEASVVAAARSGQALGMIPPGSLRGLVQRA